MCIMPTMTLAIPKEMKTQMDLVPEMNWSEIARQSFQKKLEEWQLFQSLVKDSQLTPKSLQQLSAKVNKGLSHRYNH